MNWLKRCPHSRPRGLARLCRLIPARLHSFFFSTIDSNSARPSRPLGLARPSRLIPVGSIPSALSFGVHLAALLNELSGFFFKTAFNGIFFCQTLFGCISTDIFGDAHAAEMGTAHTTKMS